MTPLNRGAVLGAVIGAVIRAVNNLIALKYI
jgi:hypothetical protein